MIDGCICILSTNQNKLFVRIHSKKPNGAVIKDTVSHQTSKGEDSFDLFNKKMSNFTNMEASLEVQDFTIAKKSIAILLWLYMQFVSNPLFIGICQFERNGGDPLKRRITDQVSSFSDCILILDMLYLRCFPAVFKLFDNLDHQSHL